ncbi:hypothetical protein F4553_003120 [Allocatelliglobosispora scoriae]|uniref:YcxB family protein n=1 Tax=Allocatelliglobosispora scoriae TaxID=643052 RepID=A0A841BSF6_9ACTN|nr:YcxB family protein [Allocatelliglobosispora scoriae]MBB5869741.1 hypothetical protein [Allocatelliglobosispora scoriae]
MRIELTFTRDRAYAVALFKYLCRRVTGLRVVLGSALILLSVPFFVTKTLHSPLVGAVFAYVGALLLLFAALTAGRAGRRMPPHWYAPQAMTFDDETVVYRSETASSEFAWSVFTSVDLCDAALILRVGKTQFWDVPRSALTTEQTVTLIRHLPQRSLPAAMFLNEHDATPSWTP